MSMIITDKSLWITRYFSEEKEHIETFPTKEKAQERAEILCVSTSSRVTVYTCEAHSGYRPLGFEVVYPR